MAKSRKYSTNIDQVLKWKTKTITDFYMPRFLGMASRPASITGHVLRISKPVLDELRRVRMCVASCDDLALGVSRFQCVWLLQWFCLCYNLQMFVFSDVVRMMSLLSESRPGCVKDYSYRVTDRSCFD